MLWDSTGASDLYDFAIVHPSRWLPINPLEEKMSLKCRHAKSRRTVWYLPWCAIQPPMLPLGLECLPFGIIIHVHLQLCPHLETGNGIPHDPLCFMQIILLYYSMMVYATRLVVKMNQTPYHDWLPKTG